jgi:S-layer family protein
MKKLIRKAMNIAGSVALVGMTVGVAAAASYPDPFTSNTAIVVGAGAAPSDNVAAASLAANLDAESAGTSTVTLSGDSITEEEVVLGAEIDFTDSEINSIMDEGDIATLLDETLSWDDGVDSDNYDIHEEIIIDDNGMEIITSFTEDDLEGVALSNNKALGYRLVFDDAITFDLVGDDDADTLYLTILGKQYEVSNMNNASDSIGVVTSEEVSLSIGESVTVEGQVFTVSDVYENDAQINGEMIGEGEKEKINGLQVKVETIGYHSNAPELSKVILRIGSEIEETYESGDEYIGEDDDEPLWVWDINLTAAGLGYIGVQYNVNINDADDDEAGDTIKYVGDSYVLPEGFGGVTLEGLTDVTYEDVKIYFDEVDLFDAHDDAEAEEDEKVVVISVPEGSVEMGNGDDTSELYVFYNFTTANGTIETYYKDIEGEYSPVNQARLESSDNLNAAGTGEFLIESLEIGDTEVDIYVNVTTYTPTLVFVTADDADDITLDLGDDLTSSTGAFEQFGATLEDAEEDDFIIGTTNIGTKEEPIMTNYGIIASAESSPEDEADSDELTLSFPDEQVFAEVSVTIGGATSSGDAGVMTVKDADVATVAGKNLVVIGGSAINSVAAELLGGAYREALFTSATGVAAGEFLIQSFSRAGETALLVAGYNAADTEKAVTYLLNNDVDTTIGTKMKGTSATEATVVTA